MLLCVYNSEKILVDMRIQQIGMPSKLDECIGVVTPIFHSYNTKLALAYCFAWE
jgi:hypothetical protein